MCLFSLSLFGLTVDERTKCSTVTLILQNSLPESNEIWLIIHQSTKFLWQSLNVKNIIRLFLGVKSMGYEYLTLLLFVCLFIQIEREKTQLEVNAEQMQ